MSYRKGIILHLSLGLILFSLILISPAHSTPLDAKAKFVKFQQMQNALAAESVPAKVRSIQAALAPKSAAKPAKGKAAIAAGSRTKLMVAGKAQAARTKTSGDPLDDWAWSNPTPTGNRFSDITYGNGVYVAVGAYGTIFTSTDGKAWTQKVSGTTGDLFGVAYSGGVFVAVGYSTIPEATEFTVIILKSPDGATWTPVDLGMTGNLYGVTYADNKFVAVGFGGDLYSGIILTSPDGSSWEPVDTSAFSAQLWDVIYGNNTFVAVGFDQDYGTSAVLTSPDGVTWSQSDTTDLLSTLVGVTYGDGTFVAVGVDIDTESGAMTGAVLTSVDNGVTWTSRDPKMTGALGAVAYGNGSFVSVGYDGSSGAGVIFTSSNGTIWTRKAAGTPPSLNGVAYVNNGFVAVGSSGAIVTSPNGSAWTARSSVVTAATLYDVAYGNGAFVAVGYGGAIATSPDGATWTKRTSGTTYPLYHVAYGNGSFMAVGYYYDEEQGITTGNVILTSTDGAAWTKKSPAGVEGYSFLSVGFGNNTFVVTGFDTNNWADVILTYNGTTWTQNTTETVSFFYGVAYGNDTFVITGEGGIIMTSPDGAAWTLQDYIVGSTLYGVTFDNGVFMVVGDVNAILTSTDGTDWTDLTPMDLIDLWTLRSVAYDAGNDAWVVVGAYLDWESLQWSGAIILTSADGGATWVSRDPESTLALLGVAYGANSFVATGGHGMIRRSSQPVFYSLNLNRSGTGSGVVTSNPTGIDCGSACSASFAGETTVTLTAVPSAGSVFKSWSGCTSSGNKCTVVMNNAKTVTAAFAVANPVKLTVSKVKQASGDGAVTSSPAGIDCGKTCSGLYAPGTSVTLSAAVSSLSTFGGWSLPSCGGTGACTFTMDKAQTVKATFIGPQVLTVTNTSASKGKGTIMTDSGNIACERGTCKGSFLYNTVVTLTAAADSGSNSVFAGWSGCTTQSPTTCTVTMDKAQSVKGTFTGPQTLTVANSSVNRGTGTVTSNPEGVACAKGTCKTPFVYKLEVTLSASADPGSYFMGWSGACSGTDDCFVTMDKARSVTAKFKKGSAPALGEEAVSVE